MVRRALQFGIFSSAHGYIKLYAENQCSYNAGRVDSYAVAMTVWS